MRTSPLLAKMSAILKIRAVSSCLPWIPECCEHEMAKVTLR